ncbi:Asp-tRNA(Asn)/Glu-tRNA(Gln) amidotransferase subunit GatC [Spirochaeta cellobiosiphila]|uniref:Asp-tRNA(Asn)/Glu-tRNA(Gln) amidotransferase subunit GatC n=1 Tax=Spirochaeta cellobiosiphila TaxID=504483 RepID=UPI0003F77C24|nr:Asp-tRNA(Asn)/Glu-tRNA(Gln) amidotransferase subunit GatC [Spirochaeta cellobiosiphila]
MRKEDLEITAELAQLRLSDEDFDRLAGEVNTMLDYFAKMMEVDVEGLEPTTHALLKNNRVRDDIPQTNQSLSDELIENAPEIEDRFIVIPNVL